MNFHIRAEIQAHPSEHNRPLTAQRARVLIDAVLNAYNFRRNP